MTHKTERQGNDERVQHVPALNFVCFTFTGSFWRWDNSLSALCRYTTQFAIFKFRQATGEFRNHFLQLLFYDGSYEIKVFKDQKAFHYCREAIHKNRSVGSWTPWITLLIEASKSASGASK